MEFRSTTITVNGQTYKSVEEMPPDVRKIYESMISRLTEDKDGDGVPDVLQGKGGNSVVQKSTRSVVFSKQYNSPEEVPPELRQLIDSAQAKPPEPGVRVTTTVNGKPVSLNQILFIAASIGLIVLAILWWMQHK
jgi:hypothetical protein